MASRTCTFVPPYLLRQIASGPGLGVIVDPHAVSVLGPTREPTITRVTCYPFYFVGAAPQRYVVRAIRR